MKRKSEETNQHLRLTQKELNNIIENQKKITDNLIEENKRLKDEYEREGESEENRDIRACYRQTMRQHNLCSKNGGSWKEHGGSCVYRMG